jgi:UDP-N-acetylglucosamine 2-epimerase (non-hydrolysing)
VGNTIVDATIHNLKIAQAKSEIMDTLNLSEKSYFLMTLHRQENVDDEERLKKIITSLEKINETYDFPIIYPIHPRTEKMLRKFGLSEKVNEIPSLKLIEPVGYLDFLVLENNAKLALTDSGGVQEESCILNVPCVTLRYNTERPETQDVGKNIVAGVESESVMECVSDMLNRSLSDDNPFGDGTTGKRIVNILTSNLL